MWKDLEYSMIWLKHRPTQAVLNSKRVCLVVLHYRVLNWSNERADNQPACYRETNNVTERLKVLTRIRNCLASYHCSVFSIACRLVLCTFGSSVKQETSILWALLQEKGTKLLPKALFIYAAHYRVPSVSLVSVFTTWNKKPYRYGGPVCRYFPGSSNWTCGIMTGWKRALRKH